MGVTGNNGVMEMVKHIIKDGANSEPVIEWSMKIDGGDLEIYANDTLVMFINKGGELARCNIGPISGLTLNVRGQIKDSHYD